jgi:hypothetical protein
VNDPIDGLSFRVEVSNVFRDAVIANRFKKPAAFILVSAKRGLRWLMLSCHLQDSLRYSCLKLSRDLCYLAIKNTIDRLT